jgi:hypothetical protein
MARARSGMKVAGRCHCGNITFQAEVDPTRVVICHCTDCQTLTGTAFRTLVVTPRDDFRLTSGTPRLYVKVGDSGNQSAQAFCANCGTPLWSARPVAEPAMYNLRVGTLDRRAELRPTKQYWYHSVLPWLADLTGVETVERQ